MAGGGGGQKFMFPSFARTTTSHPSEIMSGFLAKVAEAEAAIGAENMIGECRSLRCPRVFLFLCSIATPCGEREPVMPEQEI